MTARALKLGTVALLSVLGGSLAACTQVTPTAATTPVTDDRENVIAIGSDGVRYVDVTEAVIPERDINRHIASLGQQIKGPALIDMLSGRTGYGGLNERRGDWVEYTGEDGRAIFRDRRGNLSDGTWWVSGDLACFRYVGQSGSYCNYAVMIRGQVQYVLTNGRLDYYVTEFRNGDSENLSEALLLRNGR